MRYVYVKMLNCTQFRISYDDQYYLMLSESADQTQNQSWSIWGHGAIIQLLQSALDRSSAAQNQAAGGPRHAYLFTGPRHLGKTTLAKAFVKALLCTSVEGVNKRPCSRCRSCRLADSGNHPDIRLIYPVDRAGDMDRSGGMLRVDQAEDIIRNSALSPLESTYKCFVIQDVHTANDSFLNKLLKTLEEPPAHVVLCLTALDRSNLLPTIVSRCQVHELRPLSTDTIAVALRRDWSLPSDRADLLARLANGAIGWAIEKLGDQKSWEWRQNELKSLWTISRASNLERLAFAERLAAKSNQAGLLALLELWTVWWRDVMLAQSGCLDVCTNVDALEEIQRQAKAVNFSDVRRYITTLNRIERYVHHTTNMRMAVDVLLLQLPAVA